MSLVTKAFDLDTGEFTSIIQHDFDTMNVFVLACWQNNLNVTPSIRLIDQNSVEVYEPRRGRLILGAVKTPKPRVKKETNGKAKSEAKD